MFKILHEILELAHEYKTNLKKMFVYTFLKGIFHMFMIWGVMLALQYVVLYETQGISITATSIKNTCYLLVAGLLGKILFGYLSDYQQYFSAYSLGASNRLIIGDRLRNVSMGFFKQQRLGDLASGITQGIEYIETLGIIITLMYYQGMIQTGVMILFITPYDWVSGCIILVGLLCSMVVTNKTQQEIDTLTNKSVTNKLNLNASILDYVQGIGVIKSFGQNEIANKEVNEAIHSNRTGMLDVEKVMLKSLIRSTLVLRIDAIVLLAVSIVRYSNGMIDLSKTIMLGMASFIVFEGFELSESMQNTRGVAASSIRRCNDLLHVETMKDGNQVELKNANAAFEKVDFGYDSTLLFEDLNLAIQNHQTIALVGASGSGKTTLCHLLARFYDVNGGDVMIGDCNVKEYRYDELLSKFSFVFQDVYLFDDTIRNNICFGKMDASDEEMIQVSKAARCHEFIEEMEDGYETMLQEGGKNLSGGQRQRISIARAMLKDSQFVVLDEATSNIDPENEVKLLQALKELLKHKTVLIIAHKLKTIQDADCIVVLDHGLIAQIGTYDTLVQQEGILKDFVEETRLAEKWQVGA